VYKLQELGDFIHGIRTFYTEWLLYIHNPKKAETLYFKVSIVKGVSNL
jgi:hypothetical protein